MSPEVTSERVNAIVWFRRDLRVADHPALVEALSRSDAIVPLFVLDERLLNDAAPARTWFLRRTLAELDANLRMRGSGLLVRSGRPEEVVPQVAAELNAEVVFATRDVTPLSHRRDGRVAATLESQGRRLSLRPGLLLAEPETMLTGNGTPYGVFTPFWRRLEQAGRRAVLPAPDHIPTPAGVVDGSMLVLGEAAALVAPLVGLPSPGEAAAGERLHDWVSGGLADYGAGRDVLSGAGTSRLGVDLHFGTLSPVQVESAALEAGVEATPFIRQLAWREFYHHLLFARRASEGPPESQLMSAFRAESDEPEAVAAWRSGSTGVPVVDAAMRQLAATGWLSNRARLVVASFLTRHLLMDYRIGERHFMAHLVDGDVANNRGGWQWTAGVGADPQPWFRIFNPVRQGERFDPEGEWVRHWVPELADVPKRYVHAPWERPTPVSGYPRPVVDLAVGRERALAAFKSAAGRD